MSIYNLSNLKASKEAAFLSIISDWPISFAYELLRHAHRAVESGMDSEFSLETIMEAWEILGLRTASRITPDSHK